MCRAVAQPRIIRPSSNSSLIKENKMSAKTESANSGARPHRPRQKSKPKFELPVEAAAPEASAAWGHRSETEEVKKAEHAVDTARNAIKTELPTFDAPQMAVESNPTIVRMGVA